MESREGESQGNLENILSEMDRASEAMKGWTDDTFDEKRKAAIEILGIGRALDESGPLQELQQLIEQGSLSDSDLERVKESMKGGLSTADPEFQRKLREIGIAIRAQEK